MNLKDVLGTKNLADAKRGLYTINELEQLIDLAEQMGENVDEEKIRTEHLKRQFGAIWAAIEGKAP